MTKPRAFVTGATGFLGLNLVQLLVSKGWEVYALHRKSSNLKYLNQFSVKLKEGSVEEIGSLQAAIPEGVEAIFHVAASTNLWSRFNKQQYQTNVVGTQNMVKVAMDKQCGRFIHTSSIAAYGLNENAVTEESPSNALDSGINYYVTKYMSEQEVRKATQNGLDAVILNPAHIVGPYDTHNWVQIFKNVYHDTLPGVPPTQGSFTYAPEVAKAHLRAFEVGQVGTNYLLGGVKASMLEFVNAIQALMGKKLSQSTTPAWLLKMLTWGYQVGSLFSDKEPLLTPEKTKLLTHNVLCNDKKAQDQLSFKPVPLQTIVENTYQWLQEEDQL